MWCFVVFIVWSCCVLFVIAVLVCSVAVSLCIGGRACVSVVICLYFS